MAELLKYASVFFLSGIKFIFGPTLGISYGFNVTITSVLTALGMMMTVYLLSYFGDYIHRMTVRILFSRRKKKKIFTPQNRRFVKIWRKYGLKGVAFLTPLILTPIGGTVLANAVGGSRKSEIFRWMWMSAVIWAFITTLAVKYAFDWIKLVI
jgi:uncharacterized membrane protein